MAIQYVVAMVGYMIARIIPWRCGDDEQTCLNEEKSPEAMARRMRGLEKPRLL